MEYQGVIYRYKSPSGKYYIGQTMDEEGRRHMFLYNRKGYAGNRIDEARKKYGPKNFEYAVLMRVTGDNPDEVRSYLNVLEEFFIKKYDSYKNGYNMSEGGHNMSEESRLKMIESKKGKEPWNKGKTGVQKGYWTGKKRSSETNEKIRQTLQGRQLSEEHKRHISEGGLGKKMSDDAKRKISEARKGKPSGTKGKHYIIIEGKHIFID